MAIPLIYGNPLDLFNEGKGLYILSFFMHLAVIQMTRKLIP